jgi:hypothetical protein
LHGTEQQFASLTAIACLALQIICWVRARIVYHLLQQGFVVHNSGKSELALTCQLLAESAPGHLTHIPAPADSDVVWSLKPAWPSYLAFLEVSGADAAFQSEYQNGEPTALFLRSVADVHRCCTLTLELNQLALLYNQPAWSLPRPDQQQLPSHPAVNGGNHVALPTRGALTLFKAWAGMAQDAVKRKLNDQDGLGALRERQWTKCMGAKTCATRRLQVQEGGRVGWQPHSRLPGGLWLGGS